MKNHFSVLTRVFFLAILGMSVFCQPLLADGEETDGDLDIFTEYNVPVNILLVIDTSCIMSGDKCPNEMNFYTRKTVSYDGSSDWKINIARKIATKIMTKMAGANFGVMRIKDLNEINNSSNSGVLIAPIGTVPGPEDGSRAGTINYILMHDPHLNYYSKAQCSGCPTYDDSAVKKGTKAYLAGTLADAGRYFAHLPKFGNESGAEADPLNSEIWCQKNYVIFITSGIPSYDSGTSKKPENNIFTYKKFNNKAISDSEFGPLFQASGKYVSNSPKESYLPNAAKLLRTVNLRNFAGPVNITTYVIGLIDTSNAEELKYKATDLLNETAKRGSNNQKTAAYVFSDSTTIDKIDNDIDQMVKEIHDDASSFTAPTVPTSKTNELYSSNSVYFAYFKPDQSGLWKGNIKKYGLSDDAQLLQKDGTPVEYDSDGKISAGTTSVWSSTADGRDITIGGVVGGMKWENFKTNNGFGNLVDITQDGTKPTYAGYSKSQFGTVAKTDAEPLNIVKYLRGDPPNDKRYKLGDIIHSNIAILQMETKNILFAGSNDGFLHCFVDDEVQAGNRNSSGKLILDDDTVTKAWSFIPQASLSNIYKIVAGYRPEGGAHYNFADGGTAVYPATASDMHLCYGMRRGGTDYHVLKVGGVNSAMRYSGGYDSPSYVWCINGSSLNSNKDSSIKTTVEPLGKTWSKPYFCKIYKNSTTIISSLIFSGGYDWTTQDYPMIQTNRDWPLDWKDTATNPPTNYSWSSPDAYKDRYGKAIYAVNTDGYKLEKVWQDLVASVPDFVAFDSDGDGVTDTIYAGTTRGTIYGITDRFSKGNWPALAMSLFKYDYGQMMNDATKKNWVYKVFYAPDVVLCRDADGNNFDYIFWGTGDREHPEKAVTKDKFYGLKVNWNGSNTGISGPVAIDSAVGPSNMVDVTDHMYTVDIRSKLTSKSNSGWFFYLNGTGEKITSSPITYNGIVYFTTYIPTVQGDMCSTNWGIGRARLYAVRYETGEAAFEKTASGYFWNMNTRGNKESDRYVEFISNGMPTEIKLVGVPKRMSLIFSVAGNSIYTWTIDGNLSNNAKTRYWRQN